MTGDAPLALLSELVFVEICSSSSSVNNLLELPISSSATSLGCRWRNLVAVDWMSCRGIIQLIHQPCPVRKQTRSSCTARARRQPVRDSLPHLGAPHLSRYISHVSRIHPNTAQRAITSEWPASGLALASPQITSGRRPWAGLLHGVLTGVSEHKRLVTHGLSAKLCARARGFG